MSISSNLYWISRYQKKIVHQHLFLLHLISILFLQIAYLLQYLATYFYILLTFKYQVYMDELR